MFIKRDLKEKIHKSQCTMDNCLNSMDDILYWIEDLNKNTLVQITEANISDDTFWFYDDCKGEILNRKRSFFSIVGMRYFVENEFVSEQPIIVQNEIGYLGIIAKEFNGVIHFLMQAKIEPGNVNFVQISPTIQATKSNFTRSHGGKLPLYFDWFEHADKKGKIIYDQIQSEQGSRFVGKRNRNIILLTEEDVPLHQNYKWMTLGQIKSLMRRDNLVNMDTRTVLSGLPVALNNPQGGGYTTCLSTSGQSDVACEDIVKAYTLLNNYKMYNEVHKTVVPLNELVDWKVDSYGVTCKNDADFCVRFYNIQIQGREVQCWMQPLFKATASALFVMFTAIINGHRKFLITLSPEIGTLDKVEFGPSLQISNVNKIDSSIPMHKVFLEYERTKSGVIVDVMLSEEGGRFYHEQNRNVIIEVDPSKIILDKNQLWVSAEALNFLVAHNNVLNIQLRNLISLFDFKEEK